MDFVPIAWKVLGIKILQVVEITWSMFIMCPFSFEQKMEHICSEADSYLTGPVQTHLQTLAYASSERGCAIQNVTDARLWTIIVPKIT